MAKRIPNSKARNGKSSLILKGQEAFIPGQAVPKRMAKRIANPKVWKGSVRPRAARILKDDQAHP